MHQALSQPSQLGVYVSSHVLAEDADASRFEVEAEQVAVVAAADYYFLTNFEIDQLQIATNVAALQMNIL